MGVECHKEALMYTTVALVGKAQQGPWRKPRSAREVGTFYLN